MATFFVYMKRVVTYAAVAKVEADDPDQAVEIAAASEPEWELDEVKITPTSLSVKCEHVRAERNYDPDGFLCRDCNGNGWLDIEVPA